MIESTTGAVQEELVEGWGTGSPDRFGYTILNADTGAVVQARRTNVEQVGFAREQPAGSGVYLLRMVMPGTPGMYQLLLDDGANTKAALVKVSAVAAAPPPTTGTVRPDAALVRALLPGISWAKRGYPAPAAGDPDPLQLLVDLAADYVEQTTGRVLDATLPPQLIRVAQMAVALATVSLQSDLNDEQIEAVSGGDVLASFSADGYSETYRDTGVTLKAQREAWMVHPWPPLNRLLWMLMTPDKSAYWVGYLQGGGIPAWGIAEVDYSGANRWGGIGAEPGAGGLAGDYWPGTGGDGFGTVAPTGSYSGILGTDGPLD
jgi:hypothetical protein